MKKILTILFTLLSTFILPLSTISAQGNVDFDERLDSIQISLITCEPHNLIYALYGHTGIRIHDISHSSDLSDQNPSAVSQNDMDVIANWGIFDQSKNFFILRFTFGLTDYCMAIEPWNEFVARYEYFNCGIREQILNLTPVEKMKILQAISKNNMPENRTYRYNFFYDNCTTRARDVIENNLDGKIVLLPITGEAGGWSSSYREEIHQWNFGHLWARWGNDFLLGIGSDLQTTRQQQQFLPDTLRVDFDKAYVVSGSQKRKLVLSDRWVTPSRYDWSKPSLIDELTSPWAIGIALLFITIFVFLLEDRKLHRRLWQYDAFLLLLSGIPGLVLTAMIFSQHPTVSLNFQILVFNPLAIIFAWNIIKSLRNGRASRLMYILAACAFLGLVLSIWQDFADGVRCLALVLLVRFSQGQKTLAFSL